MAFRPVHPDSIAQRAQHLFGIQIADGGNHLAVFNGLLLRLHKARQAGRGQEVRKVQALLLKSFSAKLCSLLLSVGREDGYTPDTIVTVARELDLFHECGETVRAYAKIKNARGDWRPICAFGPRRKAQQTLVGQLLSAKFDLSPIDFMAQGRGIERAADQIIDFIDDGIDHFVIADVESCFRAVNQAEIGPRLGLPQEIVNNALLITEEEHIQV